MPTRTQKLKQAVFSDRRNIMNTETSAPYRIAQALKELVRKKPLDRITVMEITRMAGISRQTFYRHFTDKYALVNWYFERLVEHSFREMGVSLTLREGLLNKFRFIKAEKSFFACAFGSDDANSLMRYDYEYIYGFYSDIITRKTGVPPDSDTAFLLEMYCRGSIEMTARWAVGGMTRSPEQMVELLIESMPVRLEVLLRDLHPEV